ncbi:MAG TPA: hypothetical protein VF589_08880 [Allosphingosinicella sp.]|jgi:hypothetical protein
MTLPPTGSDETRATPPAEQQGAEGGGPKRRKQRVRAGLAFGIGSAAIVAALLYANRPKRKDG